MSDSALDTVWVIERGDYDDRYVFGVAKSPEDGFNLIKSEFPAPYVVRWDEPKEDKWGEWHLVGHFKGVPNYSVKHTAEFDLRKFDVFGSD